jgi:methionyl-tRNA synthetase
MTASRILGGHPSGRNYLLLVLAPTPNGRLHLGHIAGPFLRIDVLARHLRRRGDAVCVVGGTDAYESYVLLGAQQEQIQPAAVCERFHPLIHADFQALDVQTDLFMNPLDPRWAEGYANSYRSVVQRLIDHGRVVTLKERVLYCAQSSRYIVGCWLLGDCPNCHSPAGSYLCEECGHHFRPDEIEHPRSRLDEGPLQEVEIESLFARVPSIPRLREVIQSVGGTPAMRRIVESYLDRGGDLIRLTNPATWGVPWTRDASGTPRVIFTYAGLYAYALFCGEQYARLTGSGKNAFALDSGVTTVLSYGIDNAIPMQLGVLGAAVADGAYKHVDGLLGCHFYYLEGQKFSTSRKHAIWAGDIVTKTPLTSDAVRYYLALTNPEEGTSNFNVREIVEVVNTRLADRLERAVASAAANLGHPAPPPEALLARVEALIQAQDQALDLGQLRLAQVVPPIDAWIAEAPAFTREPAAAYWWLKALALLAYPLMPQFATKVWRALGHADAPTLMEFLACPEAINTASIGTTFAPISLEQLRPCFPETLRGTTGT